MKSLSLSFLFAISLNGRSSSPRGLRGAVNTAQRLRPTWKGPELDEPHISVHDIVGGTQEQMARDYLLLQLMHFAIHLCVSPGYHECIPIPSTLAPRIDGNAPAVPVRQGRTAGW